MKISGWSPGEVVGKIIAGVLAIAIAIILLSLAAKAVIFIWTGEW